jgi:hypothetical protein
VRHQVYESLDNIVRRAHCWGAGRSMSWIVLRNRRRWACEASQGVEQATARYELVAYLGTIYYLVADSFLNTAFLYLK